MIQKIQPASRLSGTLTPPPDKSISHRSALFAAISAENSTIENYSEAADPQSTLECLRQLGVPVHKQDNQVKIEGVGRDGFKDPAAPLDCGNSGTTMRLLSGMVAGAGVSCRLVGDPYLTARTMKRIIEPLNQMGCDIKGRDDEYAPLTVSAHSGICGLHYPLPIASAQLKSAVLLAGLYGRDETQVVEHTPSRDHTERLLNLKTEPNGTGTIIRSSRADVVPPQNYRIPGDFSAAAFWLVAASVNPEASLKISGVGMNPSRTAVYEILKKMGANIVWADDRMEGKEPVADLVITPADLTAIHPDPALIPNCIDELPVLMVAMCFADGTSEISGAGELRHKETDRLEAMGNILEAAGAEIELKQDGIIIHGKKNFIPKPARYQSCHDHRMAMAAAVLATRSSGISEVADAECTDISYPKFWQHLQQISS